jgi:hypothetical protein
MRQPSRRQKKEVFAIGEKVYYNGKKELLEGSFGGG